MATETVGEIIERRECRPHQLIEVLLDVQEAHGYIPEEAMRLVSDRLGVPLIEVFRVATFYKALTIRPRGQHLITVCRGTACHVRGAPRMVDEILGLLGVELGGTTADGMFTVEGVNCLGACALGPVVVLDGVYHHHVTPAKLRSLIESVRREAQEVAAHA
jgi:NADH:ubiquinone oxidoreductase subunit E